MAEDGLDEPAKELEVDLEISSWVIKLDQPIEALRKLRGSSPVLQAALQ